MCNSNFSQTKRIAVNLLGAHPPAILDKVLADCFGAFGLLDIIGIDPCNGNFSPNACGRGAMQKED